MKSNNEHRFKDNPLEELFHDEFLKMFEGKIDLSAIVFGFSNGTQAYPKEFLIDREENICLTLIQWLGSPVGQGFLDKCGFELKKK